MKMTSNVLSNFFLLKLTLGGRYLMSMEIMELSM